MPMLTEPLPISIFIKTRFTDPIVLTIMEKWRIEGETVEKMIVAHFEEMGIFHVEPHLEKLYFERMVNMLQNSPDIQSKVLKAFEAERRRKQQNRHSEN